MRRLVRLTLAGVSALIIVMTGQRLLAQDIEMSGADFFTTKDGLSASHIVQVVQDHNGFIWIATADGLNRYDGYTFEVFKPKKQDTTSIQLASISALAVSRDGNIWTGFQDGRISYYSPATRQFVNLDGSEMGLTKNWVNKIFFDSTGKMWLCAVESGLYFFDDSNKKFQHAGDLGENEKLNRIYNTINDIYEDKHGLFWLATNDGLYSFDPQKMTFKPIRKEPIKAGQWRDDFFNNLLPASNGLWLSSWGGGLSFYNFTTRQWNTYKYDLEHAKSHSHNVMLDLEWKNEKQIWVSTADKGLGVFDIEKATFTYLNSDPLGKVYNSIFKDKSDVLWMAGTAGLLRYAYDDNQPELKRLSGRKEKKDISRIYSFYHDLARHKIYYEEHLGDGLHVYDEISAKEKVFTFDILPHSSERTYVVRDIYDDRKDSLWVLTRDFIYLFDRRTEKLIKFFQPELPTRGSPQFERIIRTNDGNLAITSLRNGLFYFDFATRKFTHYVHSENAAFTLPGNEIYDIAEDTQSRLWLITENGISILDLQNKKVSNLSHIPGDSTSLSSNNLSSVVAAANGDVWVATVFNGLCQYVSSSKEIKFVRWGSEQDWEFNRTQSVDCDSYGNVWFNTPRSISSINPVSKKITSWQLNSSLEGFVLHVDTTNTVRVGTHGGFWEFKPYQQQKEKTAPLVALTSFKIVGEEYKLPENIANHPPITLEYDQNYISFEFAAMDFRQPSKNQYAYKLESLDKDWVYSGTRRYASYTYLPPGEYVFRVKAATPEGVWNETGIGLRLVIKPPVWNTWTFRFLMVVIISGGAYIVYKMRIRQVLREELMKSEYNKQLSEVEMRALRAQMNPHFIFNSLNSINFYILNADSETASLYLTKFSRLIRLILENSKNSRIVLSQEIEALSLYIQLELIRFDHRFSYNLDIHPDVNVDAIEIAPLIFQPYIENAIWHGLMNKPDHGKLDVILSLEQGLLKCIIEDNGVGRDAAKLINNNNHKSSHGMKITSERIRLLNQDSNTQSTVEVEDVKDAEGEVRGTRVTIRMHFVYRNVYDD